MGLGAALVSRLKGRIKEAPQDDKPSGAQRQRAGGHAAPAQRAESLLRTPSYKEHAGLLRPSAAVGVQYQVQKLLGSGAFADVWLGESRETHAQVAIKVIDISPNGRWKEAIQLDNVGLGHGDVSQSEPDSGLRQRAILEKQIVAVAHREADIMKLLSHRHKNIVSLVSSHAGPMRVELVMDYCAGGNLTHLISKHGRIPEPAAKSIFQQVASAVAYCHSQGIIHRDIKLDNILFDTDAESLLKHQTHHQRHSASNPAPPRVLAKLADFGTAVCLPPGQLTASGFCGSRFFLAPEVAGGQRYTAAVDVFSLGVVLYAVLAGSLPPSEEHPGGISWFWVDIEKGKVNLQLLSGRVSVEGRSLLRGMLQSDPALRPSATDVLRDPWLAGM